MMTKIHVAELMVRNAACLADAERSFRAEASMAKLLASELATQAVDFAVQVHGGYGVFDEFEILACGAKPRCCKSSRAPAKCSAS